MGLSKGIRGKRCGSHHRRRVLGRTEQRGQGLTEYIVVVCLIAIMVIVLMVLFSRNLRALFAASANEIEGQAQTSGESAGAAASDHAVKRGLRDFGTDRSDFPGD
jgi:type IV pilus assembly protein PilA